MPDERAQRKAGRDGGTAGVTPATPAPPGSAGSGAAEPSASAGQPAVPPSRPAPGSPDRDPARLAAEALAKAREQARARGDAPAGPRRAGGSGGSPPGPARRRPRREDPQPLSLAISGLLRDQGWQAAAAVGSVFGRWPQIVGPDLAAHTRPERLEGGELVVAADSTAWATQVRLLAGTLIRRVNGELGTATVTRVKVHGPEQPRRPGGWRVRGSRGPRDTYG